GPHQTRGGDRPAAPAHLRDRLQRHLRQIRRPDLGGPARGGVPRHARLSGAPRRAGESLMQARSAHPWSPTLVGVLTLVVLFAVIEALIRAGLINQYIVPPPSQILLAFPRMVTEEHILDRFLTTAGEGAAAALLIAVAIPLGVLLHRARVLCVAVEGWIGAMAAAPLVLIYPLFLVIFGRNALTIVMIGFAAGLAPVILK